MCANITILTSQDEEPKFISFVAANGDYWSRVLPECSIFVIISSMFRIHIIYMLSTEDHDSRLGTPIVHVDSL